MSTTTRWPWFTILLLVLIVLMSVEIIYLSYQNRQLRNMLTDTGGMFQTLEENQSVPPLTAQDINDNPVDMTFSGAAPHTIFLWFSQDCESCEGNFEFWKALYTKYASDKLRFISFSPGDFQRTKQFVQERGLGFPVVAATDDRFIETYRGRVLPQTVLISPTGIVLRSWPGALGKAQQDEIRQAIEQL